MNFDTPVSILCQRVRLQLFTHIIIFEIIMSLSFAIEHNALYLPATSLRVLVDTGFVSRTSLG